MIPVLISDYAGIHWIEMDHAGMDAWVTEGCWWRCVAFEFSRRTVSGTAHLLLTLRSIHGGSLPLFTWAGDGSGSDSPTVPPLGWHGPIFRVGKESGTVDSGGDGKLVEAPFCCSRRCAFINALFFSFSASMSFCRTPFWSVSDFSFFWSSEIE